jgi:hypothetical protein
MSLFELLMLWFSSLRLPRSQPLVFPRLLLSAPRLTLRSRLMREPSLPRPMAFALKEPSYPLTSFCSLTLLRPLRLRTHLKLLRTPPTELRTPPVLVYALATLKQTFFTLTLRC